MKALEIVMMLVIIIGMSSLILMMFIAAWSSFEDTELWEIIKERLEKREKNE